VSGALAIAAGHNPNATPAKRRWRTPPALFAAVDARYSFGLDAAAEEGAGLCLAHITPEMNTLVTPWASMCLRNADGERWAYLNSPWGPPGNGFPGTRAFTRRALDQFRTLDGAVLLLPTAADTSWWRELFAASAEVRLLPRIAFIDPDTGRAAEAPPGDGCTLFELRARFRGERRVLLADELGRGA
jgi:phage N-6-adenine-methyltransferase